MIIIMDNELSLPQAVAGVLDRIDAVAGTLVAVLASSPLARVLVLVYAVALHIWVMVVLSVHVQVSVVLQHACLCSWVK